MKIVILLLLVLSPLSLKAQESNNHWYLIPRAGITFSGVYGKEWDSKMRTGFVAGAEVEGELDEHFGFRTGLFFTSLGGKMSHITYNEVSGRIDKEKILGPRYNWVMNYLCIPLIGEWRPVKNLSLMAGFQFGIRVNKHGHGKKDDEITGRNSNPWWASIPVGLSYNIGPVMLDARYNLGLSVLSGDSGGQRLDAITVSLGYRFDMGVFKNKKPKSKFHLPEIGH